MAEIFEHVDDLPVEPHDGTACGIRIPSAHVEHLIYHEAQNAWIGRQHWSMRVYQNEGFSVGGDLAFWRYPGDLNEIPETGVHRTPHQFQIHKILNGGELYAAGLRLQEHLTAQIKEYAGAPTPDDATELALAWYPLADGDDFLSPLPFNHGVRLVGSDTQDGVNYRQVSTGWQNVPDFDTEPALDEHLYPEVYALGSAIHVRELTARHRWAAGDLGGAGDGEDSGYRPTDRMIGWYQAEQIYVADGQPVAEWPDFSGWGITLVQETSGKRPVVMSESGIRFVRFDGSNDSLHNITPRTQVIGGGPGYTAAVPLTIYMVMRQRAAGATQQVWLGTNGGGATLIYRGDATDQVNYWSGGSDATYDRGSAWPSPWMVWSSELHADGSLTIWEGQTEVFDGSAGTTGFNGLVMGNNQAESLPAAIDVAEMLWTNFVPASGERAAVVAYLEDKYGL
jgi:hypothetical protein